MEKNSNQENAQLAAKKESPVKWRMYLVFALILIAVGVYGYYWYQQTSELRFEAQTVIDRAGKFDILADAVNAERDRCEKFIARKVGDFGSFEYCGKFIDWADILPILE